jgi:hypothetical protein
MGVEQSRDGPLEGIKDTTALVAAFLRCEARTRGPLPDGLSVDHRLEEFNAIPTPPRMSAFKSLGLDQNHFGADNNDQFMVTSAKKCKTFPPDSYALRVAQ